LPVPLTPTTTIRLPWSEYFAPIDDIPRLRIAYVDRAPELFVRLAAGGFRNVSPSISIT
jgi:hypothetical protein